MSHRAGIVLLAIRGTVIPKTYEDVRKVHNETAGNDQGVAAAKALGDLSHNIFIPFDAATKTTELLFLDNWNNPQGLQQFFSDAQVQAGGNLMFSSKDPTVWTPAEECASYSLPTPAGKNDRYVGLLRATVKSRNAAAEGFNALVKASANAARRNGQISHDVYFRLMPPGEKESLELFAVDTWMDGDGMKAFYDDPKHMAPLANVFAGAPVASVWKRPAGSWIEW